MEATEEEQLRAHALEALRRVRPKQYDVVSLYLGGHTQEAIAVQLGMPQGNVSRTLLRGATNFAKLQTRINRRQAGNRNNS